ILRNPQLGSVSAALTATGRGFTPNSINTNFKGEVYSLGFNNYTYRNIAMTGWLNKSNFSADIDAADPNAYFDISARGNFSETPSFVVTGFVDSLKTLPLNFTTQPLVFRGKIDADIPNADPNNLEANVLITNSLFVSGTERLAMDTVSLVAAKRDTGQYIGLKSDVANAELTGRYQLTDLGNIIINNIQPYFAIAPSGPPARVAPYDIHFTADVVYSPILGSFVPGLTAMEPLHAEGRLATGQGMQAIATTQAVVFNGNNIQNVAVNVNTADSGMHILGTIAHVQSGAMDLYNARIEANALNNNVDFKVRVGDRANENKYLLAGLFTQPSPGIMRLQLSPDSLTLNYQAWTVSPDNSITITPEQILANNFVLQHDGQSLAINSGPGTGIRPLNVAFTDFKLGTITGFIQDDTLFVDGTLNGNASFRNLMQQPAFTSDLTISNLSFKQDTIGNMDLQVATAGSRYNANARITGFGNDVALTGSFEPQGSDLALNLDLAINRLELATLEGALSGFVTRATGGINGNVSINGTSSQPKVQGTLNFDNAAVSTTILGGPLTINDESINVTEQGFAFNNFTIRDTLNNTLNLDGAVTTTNFINYGFDLDVDADNFRAVSTTKKESDIYYGDLVISTDMHIGGTEQAPVIDGSVTVNDGTQFSVVIPQAEPGLVEREGVVEFVDFDSPLNDSLFLAAYDSLNTTSLVGFDITTNIEIQKEAIFNIVVDVANGDFLNVRGTGQVSAGIDPSGKITMAGSYEIEEGAYQFSFNFLQRRFDIEKGSKIIWMGEPTDAQVDVRAIYIANTPPMDLVEDQIDDTRRNFYRQKLPFQIVLNLDGELMKPTITFDILLPEDQNYNVGSDVVSVVNTRLTQLRQEPSELNKQVFAVLLLNRFVGENPFAGSDGGGFSPGSLARQSVSKLLTEQLNNLAGGLIAGVDIQFGITSSAEDYSTGTQQNRTDLNVGLSKRLLNDRLTVSVGNDFQLEGARPANSSANNIAGNVSVNYQLSKDGRYMLRFFRNNEYEASLQGYVIETGLGFIMTVDYNNFRQLLRGRRERPAAKREENNQKEEQ
ncbi:MAG: translocation/assembly module TamB domain-containing protein, partial [Chitinophagaceae bacterium]